MKYAFLLGNLMYCFSSLSQDYLVNWQNDTLQVTLPANPTKSAFKPGWKYRNGYQLLPVVFANDSVRVINAGEIKAYYRQKHGKGLLCDGIFESIKVAEGIGKKTNAEGKVEYSWYFMQPVLKGDYASLYKILVSSKRVNTYYYVKKHFDNDVNVGKLIVTLNDAVKLLAVPGHGAAMEKFIRKNKRYTKMVAEYNRLMATIAKP